MDEEEIDFKLEEGFEDKIKKESSWDISESILGAGLDVLGGLNIYAALTAGASVIGGGFGICLGLLGTRYIVHSNPEYKGKLSLKEVKEVKGGFFRRPKLYTTRGRITDTKEGRFLKWLTYHNATIEDKEDSITYRVSEQDFKELNSRQGKNIKVFGKKGYTDRLLDYEFI